MDKILDDILKNNIWNYFKAINYSYKDIYKIFNNSKGKEIGYLVLNESNLKQIEEIYNYMKENKEIRMDKNETNDLKIDKFYSFLLCLYNIKELYDKLIIYYNGKDKSIIKILFNFVSLKKLDDNIKQYFFESLKSNDYKFIINDIFEKINSELNNQNKNDIINNHYNQAAQYDEIKAKKIFLENNKKTSIINQLFFILKEDIIFCNEYGMNIYNFYYSNFFLIDLDKEEKEILLTDKILSPENIQIKQKFNFYSGKEIDCNKKIKIVDYPEILIVLLDGNQFNKFILENNIYILCNNNQDILYYLISFIESGTNNVYFEKNNNWYKYIDQNKIESQDYKNKNPIVLFYKLTYRKYINEIINDNKNKINKDNNLDFQEKKKYQTQIFPSNDNINNPRIMNKNNNFNINNFNFNPTHANNNIIINMDKMKILMNGNFNGNMNNISNNKMNNLNNNMIKGNNNINVNNNMNINNNLNQNKNLNCNVNINIMCMNNNNINNNIKNNINNNMNNNMNNFNNNMNNNNINNFNNNNNMNNNFNNNNNMNNNFNNNNNINNNFNNNMNINNNFNNNININNNLNNNINIVKG